MQMCIHKRMRLGWECESGTCERSKEDHRWETEWGGGRGVCDARALCVLLWERRGCESIALGCVSGDTAGFLSVWFLAQSFR